jgi:glutaredoxin 3
MAEVKIFTTSFCPYCVQAKRLLDRKNVPYVEIDVGGDDALREEMVAAAEGRRTVPQIFIGGQGIGGFEELWTLEQNGQLDQLLAG